jgi:hypothetical protein
MGFTAIFPSMSYGQSIYYLTQSLEQAPFTSEIVGSILAVYSCEKNLWFSPGAPVSHGKSWQGAWLG